jgi:hypothetical protein
VFGGEGSGRRGLEVMAVQNTVQAVAGAGAGVGEPAPVGDEGAEVADV